MHRNNHPRNSHPSPDRTPIDEQALDQRKLRELAEVENRVYSEAADSLRIDEGKGFVSEYDPRPMVDKKERAESLKSYVEAHGFVPISHLLPGDTINFTLDIAPAVKARKMGRKVLGAATEYVVGFVKPMESSPSERHLVGSSRVDLQACKLEYSIVSPK